MKLKELESELQPLKGFEEPKRELEQYVTSPHLASRMIYTAATQFEDIEDKNILDLGCGCGILSIASIMMGAESILSVDIDLDAIKIAKENVEEMEMENEIEFLHSEISMTSSPSSSTSTTSSTSTREEGEGGVTPIFTPSSLILKDRKIDTVVMNPPFGSWNKGIDMVFLEVACSIAETSIYSLNKSSTREFISRKVKTFGFKGEVIAEMKYDLPKTMKFHKFNSVDIQVDMWRFVREKAK